MTASTYVALLRAVNADGVNSLPTKDLVRLYIQSGNAVFQARKTDAPKLPQKSRRV